VSLTFSAITTVPAGFAAPTGQVVFSLAGATPFSPSTALGTVPLSSGSATLQVSNLAVGTDYVQAQYSGDAAWPAKFGQLILAVQPSSTTTSVTVTTLSGQLL
jgi:Bacterial Ig-like domain (group 3)